MQCYWWWSGRIFVLNKTGDKKFTGSWYDYRSELIKSINKTYYNRIQSRNGTELTINVSASVKDQLSIIYAKMIIFGILCVCECIKIVRLTDI